MYEPKLRYWKHVILPMPDCRKAATWLKIQKQGFLVIERSAAMTYIFACPFPCNRVISVDAGDADDAVRKIIKAGGLTCRNGESHIPCKITHPQIPPLSDRQLRELIRSTMKQEDFPVVSTNTALECAETRIFQSQGS